MRLLRASVVLALAAPASAQTLVVEAPRILTGAPAGSAVPEVLEPGAILVRDGKVVQIGRAVGIPPDAHVLRLPEGSVLVPGFVDAGSSREFEGDRAAFSLDMDPLRAVADAPDAVRSLLGQGVTTVLARSASVDGNGSRMVALEAAGDHRGDRVVSPLVAIRFPIPDGTDPLLLPDRLQGRLNAGKAYHQKWLDHFKALAEWEKAQEEGRKVEAQKPKPAEAPVTAPTVNDPLSGVWELTSEGGRRGPTTQTLTLRLQGTKVDGALDGGIGGGRPGGGGGGGARAVFGTFQNGKLELDTEGDQFAMHISAEVSGETMTGSMRVGDRFDRPFTGKRIEKGSSSTPIVVRRRKTSADGRPVPPPVQEEFEPYRALFEKRIPLALEVGSELALRFVMPVCKQFEVDVVVISADPKVLDAARSAEWSGVRGVVVPSPEVLASPAAYERWAGGTPDAPFALQASADGLRGDLGDAVFAAVHRGLSPLDALRALTSDPARMFGLDSVGWLERGRAANFLVFSGEPFEPSSTLERVFVHGVEQDKDVVAEIRAAPLAPQNPGFGRRGN